MAVAGWILLALLGLYEWILIARAIMSWVQVINPRWTPHGLLLVLAEACYTLTDPPLKWLRKLIRPLRIGNVQLDLAFFVLFLLVILLSRVVSWVFFL